MSNIDTVKRLLQTTIANVSKNVAALSAANHISANNSWNVIQSSLYSAMNNLRINNASESLIFTLQDEIRKLKNNEQIIDDPKSQQLLKELTELRDKATKRDKLILLNDDKNKKIIKELQTKIDEQNDIIKKLNNEQMIEQMMIDPNENNVNTLITNVNACNHACEISILTMENQKKLIDANTQLKDEINKSEYVIQKLENEIKNLKKTSSIKEKTERVTKLTQMKKNVIEKRLRTEVIAKQLKESKRIHLKRMKLLTLNVSQIKRQLTNCKKSQIDQSTQIIELNGKIIDLEKKLEDASNINAILNNKLTTANRIHERSLRIFSMILENEDLDISDIEHNLLLVEKLIENKRFLTKTSMDAIHELYQMVLKQSSNPINTEGIKQIIIQLESIPDFEHKSKIIELLTNVQTNSIVLNVGLTYKDESVDINNITNLIVRLKASILLKDKTVLLLSQLLGLGDHLSNIIGNIISYLIDYPNSTSNYQNIQEFNMNATEEEINETTTNNIEYVDLVTNTETFNKYDNNNIPFNNEVTVNNNSENNHDSTNNSDYTMKINKNKRPSDTLPTMNKRRFEQQTSYSVYDSSSDNASFNQILAIPSDSSHDVQNDASLSIEQDNSFNSLIEPDNEKEMQE